MRAHIFVSGLSVFLFSTGLMAADVTCETETGSGAVSNDGGEIQCASGLGMGWANGSQGDSTGAPDVDTDAVGAPDDPNADAMPVEMMTDAQLYDMCLNEVEMNCGTEIPDPATACDSDSLAKCTAFVVQSEALEANCQETWYNDDVVTNSGNEMIVTSPDSDADGTSTAPAAGGAAGDVNPWRVVDCCNQYAAEREEPVEPTDLDTAQTEPMPAEDVDTGAAGGAQELWWTDWVNCILAVAPDACQDVLDCDVSIYGNPKTGEVTISSTEQNTMAVSSDPDSPSDPNEKGQATDSDADSGSCSVVSAGSSNPVFSLLRILFNR